MVLDLPRDLQDFMSQQLAAGAFATPDEMIGAALALLRDLKARQGQLEADIRVGIEQAEQGLAKPLDVDALLQRVNSKLKGEGVID